MQLAKAVASAAAALVLKAKSVAQKTEDSALQTQVIAAATQCALSTSQLVACTKVSDAPLLSPDLFACFGRFGRWNGPGLMVPRGRAESFLGTLAAHAAEGQACVFGGGAF